MQIMRIIGIRYESSTEIGIRIFSGDSLIRHGGIWNCGGTAPITLESELEKKKGVSLKRRVFFTEERPPVKE
jgi:hypothetical protein